MRGFNLNMLVRKQSKSHLGVEPGRERESNLYIVARLRNHDLRLMQAKVMGSNFCLQVSY